MNQVSSYCSQIVFHQWIRGLLRWVIIGNTCAYQLPNRRSKTLADWITRSLIAMPCYVAVCNNYAVCNKLQTALNCNQFVIHYKLRSEFKKTDKTEYEINVQIKRSLK